MINTYRSFSKMSDMFNMMDMFNGSFNGNQANMDSGFLVMVTAIISILITEIIWRMM